MILAPDCFAIISSHVQLRGFLVSRVFHAATLANRNESKSGKKRGEVIFKGVLMGQVERLQALLVAKHEALWGW